MGDRTSSASMSIRTVHRARRCRSALICRRGGVAVKQHKAGSCSPLQSSGPKCSMKASAFMMRNSYSRTSAVGQQSANMQSNILLQYNLSARMASNVVCRRQWRHKRTQLFSLDVALYNSIILLDYVSTAVFAWEGTWICLTSKKDLSIIGIIALAMITALGGGSIRDVLASRPSFWIEDPKMTVSTNDDILGKLTRSINTMVNNIGKMKYITIVTLVSVMTLVITKWKLRQARTTNTELDKDAVSSASIETMSIGVSAEVILALRVIAFATFSVIGSCLSLVYERALPLACVFGIVGSCGGGIIRDIILNINSSNSSAPVTVLYPDKEYTILSSIFGSALLMLISALNLSNSVVIYLCIISVAIIRIKGKDVVQVLIDLHVPIMKKLKSRTVKE